MCRGKLHVELFDEGFPGETQEGARLLVEKLRAAVNIRFQNVDSKPNVVFVDRGRGFYNPGSGHMTRDFKEALAEHNFRGIMGENAARQPGSIQDLLLHETAISWLRHRLIRSTPKACWEESREQYGRRLKRCCDEVNKEYDVEGLCHGYPKRLKLLQESQGGRLQK